MIAADIMTRDVATVRPETTLAQAIQVMLDRHVSGLPVLDSFGRLVGILSEGDLLRRVETGTEAHASWLKSFFQPERLAESFVKANGRHVSDVMQPNVISAAENTPLDDIVTAMEAKHIKRLPILSDDVLVGIVACSDLVRALARVLRGHPVPLSDAGITQQLQTTLSAAAWTPHGVTCSVTDGRVKLYGTLFQERDRGAIRVAAENVAGVISVADHMVFVEPNTGMTFSEDMPARF